MRGNCQQLLKQVYETGFALDEMQLYLDTHPRDREALSYYQYMRQKYREARSAYEQSCGPLMADEVQGDSWSWGDGPWPWEGGGC